jgi:hypothetical protein
MTLHAVSNSPPFVPVAPQFFPCDAHAVIYRPARSAMTSGKARTRDWKLCFERRTPPFIEPLMGWTGGDDTLTQVEPSFPTVESAIAYARRQGLTYTVRGMPQCASQLRVGIHTTDTERANAAARRERLEGVERRLGPQIMRHGFGQGPRRCQAVCRSQGRAERRGTEHGPKEGLASALGVRCVPTRA